jgi:hypothetical protein
LEETYHLTDDRYDILSHRARRASVHVLTLDPVLAGDVCERIGHDPRTKGFRLFVPRQRRIREAVEEIESMAAETVSSRLLVIDVRKATMPKLRRAYNKVVGYNRRDLNKLCFIILIGDGPWDLFWGDKTLDVFVTYLAAHRVDFRFPEGSSPISRTRISGWRRSGGISGRRTRTRSFARKGAGGCGACTKRESPSNFLPTRTA